VSVRSAFFSLFRRLLTPDVSRLQAAIYYAPSFSPPPASFLRQQAYLQGGFLLPPSEDPTGWHSLPETRFQQLFQGSLLDLELMVRRLRLIRVYSSSYALAL
jgi:hypothetical protein